VLLLVGALVSLAHMVLAFVFAIVSAVSVGWRAGEESG